MFGLTESRCREYEARMEEHVASGPEAVESDLELAAHLRGCPRCRESFAAAQLSARFFAAADTPEVLPSEAFVTRVMASIREQEALRAAPSPVWHPLEALASKFALVAAMALLAITVFVAEFTPALRQPEYSATAPLQQEAVGTAAPAVNSDWPEPPAQPATQDDVLMSLVDVDNGI